jgi:Plasmid pRiA4b ORF-3-like protein
VAVKTTRLRVTLREVAPPVVRVLDVPAAVTLPELHDLLQVGIGWTDSHLHQFGAGRARYGIPDPDFADLDFADLDTDLHDERTATLRDLPARFSYQYDFGDNWDHDIEVLGVGGPEPGCVHGEGACPSAECGGVPGYDEFRTAIADPTQRLPSHLRPDHHRPARRVRPALARPVGHQRSPRHGQGSPR